MDVQLRVSAPVTSNSTNTTNPFGTPISLPVKQAGIGVAIIIIIVVFVLAAVTFVIVIAAVILIVAAFRRRKIPKKVERFTDIMHARQQAWHIVDESKAPSPTPNQAVVWKSSMSPTRKHPSDDML
jgi:uncharacterized membrane protein